MRSALFRVCSVVWIVIGVAPSTAFAYEQGVHIEITENAFTQVFVARDFLADLGITATQVINNNSNHLSAQEWVIAGSNHEDDICPPCFPPRSSYHFFDPTNGQGLNGVFLGVPYSYAAAPDWAADATKNPLNSIQGARQSMFLALTSTDSIVRDKAWANTFQAVGQFTHLLQDTDGVWRLHEL